MNRKDFILLFFILIIALAARLYRINTPLGDFHSWRQADTAAVARNFVRGGFDLLRPRYDDLSGIQTGKDNPQGYRMVEFPLYNAIFALEYKFAPVLPIEIYGRLTSVFFSLFIIVFIYYLLRHEQNQVAAFFGSLIFAIFPFFVFFSRTVLPETTAVFFTFLSIALSYLSVKKNGLRYLWLNLVSAIFFACAVLVKPTAIFYILPIVYLYIRKFNTAFFKKPILYFFLVIAFTPLFMWRNYIKLYPEGIPASDWLITSVNTYDGLKNIFFRPAFFRWIFFERINNIILGGYLTIFFILGVIKKPKNYFLHCILISALVYLFVFQGGNVQHEYYQTIILPTLAIFTGIGLSYALKNTKEFIHSLIMLPLMFFLLAISLYFSFYKVRNYYDYSSDLVSTANILKTLTTPDDRVVTDTTGDTTLLYLADRKGLPATTADLQVLKNKGYSYFITQKQDVIKDVIKEKKHPLIFENDKFAIFKL